jgi:hypothetical protein
MRYFTYELVAAANSWVEQSDSTQIDAEHRYRAVVEAYGLQLDLLEGRLSRSAFQFFRYGFGSKGLHDGRLLSLNIGDGLSYTPNGNSPFLINRQRAAVTIEFLNYEQDLNYVFDLRGISRLSCDLFVGAESYAKSIGDLYTCELTAAGNDKLRLGFLFASGASMVVEFRKMVFRKRRIKRNYPIGDMYA